MADALGRAAVADCEDLVERGCEGSERAGIVLSRVDNFLKALPDDGRLPRLQEMLQSLNELLAQIRSGLPNAHRLRKLEVDYERRRGDMRGLRSQLKDVIRERDQDRKGFKEEQRLQREAWAREKAALRSRLEMLTRELGAERANAQEVELAKNTTDAEKRQWMLSATRYKKKYYALKAQISARNRFKASGGESDDSLEVVS
ncbi:hypothetical protein CERSUDRAFT_93473 [Gelatoporia subvermispora B]|uniref:Uncharacterized protein n=1 Tax=Ceriporiopsis subvermispora (strain B) TaxID=914234 RepID=M2PNF4_CERS8|nr:hypothetical protein CERSUDRAFT_93473 [Gelatoporia subvermispora B]